MAGIPSSRYRPSIVVRRTLRAIEHFAGAVTVRAVHFLRTVNRVIVLNDTGPVATSAVEVFEDRAAGRASFHRRNLQVAQPMNDAIAKCQTAFAARHIRELAG